MAASPLTVLHVDSAREYRGGQNQVRLLMAGLVTDGSIRQALIAADGSRLIREAETIGVDVRPAPWRAAFDRHALAALRSAFTDDWDVVHAHDGHALQLVLLARAIEGSRSPVVAARRVDFAPRSSFVWRRAELIVAVSERIREVLLARGIDRRRVEVVYSGIDPAELEPADSAEPEPGAAQGAAIRGPRAAAGVLEGELLVAAVGALVGHKDHVTFVRAAARLVDRHPDVRFAVFGEGSCRPTLERLVRDLDLEDRFRLPGEIPNVAGRLDEVDVFVMPSREEGLGTACLEAMFAGRPVVGTAAGGLKELAADGAFRPLPPEEPEALATEIGRLISDPAARREAAEAARSGATRFTAERMVEGTLRCYRALAAGTR